ncbi:hypothetical protein MMC22_000533 [Lobaria immixta]|nr:hypothetical protein [Lobaria immixta]
MALSASGRPSAEDSTSLVHFDTAKLLDELQNRVLPAKMAVGADVETGPNPDDDNHDHKKLPGFEFSEHMFLGDDITLLNDKGEEVEAKEWPFQLDNGVTLTYGKISGLAGDFYGTDKPISDVTNFEESITRFNAAFNTLAKNTDRTPDEVKNILDIVQQEVEKVEAAIKNDQDPWDSVWPTLPDVTAKLQEATRFRPDGEPSYLGLANINFDHFGVDARTAYKAGHQAAMNTAREEKSEAKLVLAYAMNAFADHFLQDAFAAGHLRTPRRALHGSILDPTPDLCAKFMHDEDCAIGLSVRNEMDKEFIAYGDKRLFSKQNKDNLGYCLTALQISAREIYDAWKDQIVSTEFAALKWAPTISSALDISSQELKPLFVLQKGEVVAVRRADIKNRRDPTTTSSYWYWSTALDCKLSKQWKYPQPKMDPDL